MSRPTKIVVDCSTGVESIIELTDEEIAQAEADRVAYEAEMTARQAAEETKAAAKASALAKLAALGLTEDEAKAIAG